MKKQRYQPRPKTCRNAFLIWGFLFGFPVLPAVAEEVVSDQAKKLDSIRMVRKEKLAAFRQSYPAVRVRIDSTLGTPKWLEGKLGEGLTKSDPVEIALEFFEKNKGVFGIAQPLSELKLEGVRKDEVGMKHVFFKQFYNGIEVWNGKINVHFTPKGKLDLINGSLYPDIGISSIPSIDLNSASGIAQQDIPSQSKHVQVISKSLVVFPFQNEYYLSWLVKIHVDSPLGAWEYFIDASSGQILHKANRNMRLNSKENLSRTTFAQVKRPVPLPIDTARQIFPDSSAIQAKPSKNVPKELQPIPMESTGVGEPKKPVIHDSNVIVAPPPGSSPETLKVLPKTTPPSRKLPVDDSIPSVTPIPSVPSTKPISPGKAPRVVPTKKKKKAEADSSQIKSVPQSNTSQVLPDLASYLPSGWSDRIVVSGVRWTNTHSPVVVGEWAFIDWAGENRGSSIGVRFTSVLRIDGIIAEYFDTYPPLDQTEYFFFEDFEWTFSSYGLHTIQIEYDYYNEVAESDETNNTYAIAVTVQPTPDLVYTTPSGWAGPVVVSNIAGTHTQSPIYANEWAYIDWAGKNQGGMIRNSFYTIIRINGFVVSQTPTFPDVYQNQIYSYEDFAIVLGPPGTYNIQVEHDYYNDVYESSESNNITPVYQVTVQAIPDLACHTPTGWPDPIVVSNVINTNSQSSPIAGQTAFIDFAVINQGTGPTTSRFYSRILDDGVPVPQVCYKDPPLNTNTWVGCYDIPYTFTTYGTHWVTAEHDYLNNIDEGSNEANNSCGYQVNVLPGANLKCYTPTGWDGPIVVSNVTGTTTQFTPTAGDPAYIDLAGKNAGTEKVYVNFWSKLYVDNVLVWSGLTNFQPDPNVGFIKIDFQYTFASAGTHTLRLVHDSEGDVAESDDSDNSCTYGVYVNPAPVCTPDPAYPPGTGIGVHGDTNTHIDTKCNGIVYLLMDETRRAATNPHGHNGRMFFNATISTHLWNGEPYPGLLLPDPDNIWNSPDHPEGVDAHVHAGWTYDYLDSVLDRNGFDSLGSTMTSTVESYDGSFDNAEYDYFLYQVIYYISRSPGNVPSTAGSLDLAAHEWGHGVTHFSSDLLAHSEPGALNEAFSDMLAVSVGFSYNDRDWEIGEDIPGIVYRDLSNPRRFGQADTYLDVGRGWRPFSGCTPDPIINDNCWIHWNSCVGSYAFYLYANGGTHPFTGLHVNGIGNIDSAMKVMYTANANRYWPTNATFVDAMYGSLRAAAELDPDLTYGAKFRELLKAWEAVKVCVPSGDIYKDDQLTPADVVRQLLCLFNDRSICDLCHSDVNCDGKFLPSDAVGLLMMAFLNAPSPCPYTP